MTGFLYLALVGLVLKHLLADYLLQTPWMIAGKAQLRHGGGYTHAGIHAAGTLVVLLLVGVAPALALLIAVAEFALHYGIDFAKAVLSDKVDQRRAPRAFWAWFGFDQTLHSLTYIGIVAFVDAHFSGVI